ncbi:MAG: hypothetical protein F9B45_30830 [Phycisphaera sp. RhM]|nr:hypothetical protein [Phycisphaera sp. RhM]
MRIFVEAKLHSGFGDLQIVRQLLIGLADPKPCRDFFLLLVTKGFHAPRIPFENKKYELPEYLKRIAPTLAIPPSQQVQLAGAHDRILWINWRTLALLMQECRRIQPAGICSRGHDDMLEDLKQLLILRSLAPFHGISSSIPKLFGGRPVIASFLTSKVSENRKSSCFTSLAKRSLDSTISFRSPTRREKGRFQLQQAVARWESPSAIAWKFRPKDRAGDRLALHRLVASRGEISRTPQLWALSPSRKRFNFAHAVRHFNYPPSGPLLLRSQNER